VAAYPDFATAPREASETPVELLAVGCSLTVADGFANALRNQGQAAHLKTADTAAALEQQLSSDSCDLVVINADAEDISPVEIIGKVRAHNPTARLMLVCERPGDMRNLAVDLGLQDVIDIGDEEHVALAVRREHETLMLRLEAAQLKRQLEEAEERSNLLVQSSRDAIAYINARPRPLGLYYFGQDSQEEAEVLARTTSGGVTVNDVIQHVAQEALPFGGVGPSGMGTYHGEEGFREFSHARSIYRQSSLDIMGIAGIRPPYGTKLRQTIKREMKG